MNKNDLINYLQNNNIQSLEFEDTNGNTILLIDLMNVSVADVEDNTLRIQEL